MVKYRCIAYTIVVRRDKKKIGGSGIMEKLNKEQYTEEEKDTILATYVNYANMEKEGKKGKEKLRPVIDELIGTADELTTKNHKAYYTLYERKSFDEEGLKAKYFDIWQEFAGKKAIVSLNVK